MTKYDEIMEKINLSPEARDRIIENVIDEMSSDDGYVTVRVNKNRSRTWRKYITVAACCILVAAGAAAASRNGLFTDILGGSSGDGEEAEYSNELVLESEEGTSEQKSAAASEEGQDAAAPEDTEVPAETGTASIPEYGFSGEAELSDELGFSMSCPEIQRISEEAGLKDVSYGILNGNIGEIIYTDGEKSNYFRKAAGTDDISGDYNVYDTELEFDGTDRSGTLKGKPDEYKLAVWTSKDGFTYAAYVEEGLTDKEWFGIIDSLTGAGEKQE